MEPLIYYPNFEPPDNSWLKFSLLYLENFRPIVPYNRRNLLSDNFREIEEKTDLIELFSPNHESGYRATLNSIEDIEKLFLDNYSRSYLFREVNLLRKWQSPKHWTYELCQEKFSHEWIAYCKEKKIGEISRNGIMLPEEVAFLFMTNLAKDIAFTTGSAIITDSTKFDNYTNLSRAKSPKLEQRMNFAKGIINLIAPANLSEIPFKNLIKFRNKNRKRIAAFNAELSNIQDKISAGYTERDFISQYNKVYSEFTREVISTGLGIVAIPFAAYILITNSLATTPEYVKEILGAMGVVLGGGLGLNKGLIDIKTKRYCKKYLTNLGRLK